MSKRKQVFLVGILLGHHIEAMHAGEPLGLAASILATIALAMFLFLPDEGTP